MAATATASHTAPPSATLGAAHDTSADTTLTLTPTLPTTFTMRRNPLTGRVEIITQQTPDGNVIAHNAEGWRKIKEAYDGVMTAYAALPQDKKTPNFNRFTIREVRCMSNGTMEFDTAIQKNEENFLGKVPVVSSLYKKLRSTEIPSGTEFFNQATLTELQGPLATLLDAASDDRHWIGKLAQPDALKDTELHTSAVLWRDTTKPLDAAAMKSAMSVAPYIPGQTHPKSLPFTCIKLTDHATAGHDLSLTDIDTGYVAVEIPGPSSSHVGFIIDKQKRTLTFVDPNGKKLANHPNKAELERIQDKLCDLIPSSWNPTKRRKKLDNPQTLADGGRALIDFFIQHADGKTAPTLTTERIKLIADTIQSKVCGPVVTPPTTPAERAKADLLNTTGDRRIQETTIEEWCKHLQANCISQSVNRFITITPTTTKGFYYYNTPGNHFVFFFVDATERNIYFYDSKGVSAANRASSHGDFQTVFNNIKAAHPEFTVVDIPPSTLAHQGDHDSVQCGPYGLLFAKAMLAGASSSTAYTTFTSTPLRPDEVQTKRAILAAEI